VLESASFPSSYSSGLEPLLADVQRTGRPRQPAEQRVGFARRLTFGPEVKSIGAMASTVIERLDEAAAFVRSKSGVTPKIGLVLGSGLGGLADSLTNATAIPYDEIPHMPVTSVTGHAGKMILGDLAGVDVACLRGRVHLYEGHAASDAVFAVRLLQRLGCWAVLLTNAAGGIRTSFTPGTLMLIADHINLTGDNPLRGANHDALGPRFPDMSRAYDPRLSKLARDAAAKVGVRLEEGVYVAVQGPSYETPAEIRMLRTMGADAVGMSTVYEVIALRHVGVRVAAISCITNMAAGMTATALDHAEVEATANEVKDEFVKLLTGWIESIGAANWDHGTGRFTMKP
jgi:purine-nucleoside phosphorylase